MALQCRYQSEKKTCVKEYQDIYMHPFQLGAHLNLISVMSGTCAPLRSRNSSCGLSG